MKITNNNGLPEILYNAVIKKHYKGYVKGSFASASALTQPDWQWALSKSLKSSGLEIEAEADTFLDALMGTAMHWVIEQGADQDHIISEKTFQHEVQGDLITGTPDYYNRFTRTLYDLKTMKTGAVYRYKRALSGFEAQLNIYAYLLEKNGHSVDSVAITAIFKDWSAVDYEKYKSQGYPGRRAMDIKLELWTIEEREQFIVNQIVNKKMTLAAIESGNYSTIEQECTKDERWENEPTFAVMRDGNKRATKVFDSLTEASEFATVKGDEFNVITRTGTRIRCEKYCMYSGHCAGYQNYLGKVKV